MFTQFKQFKNFFFLESRLIFRWPETGGKPEQIAENSLAQEVEQAMQFDVKAWTKSKAAYVLLKVLDRLYPDNKILTETEKQNKIAKVGQNWFKFLKKFQKEKVPYFRDKDPDGVANAGAGTWRTILETVKLRGNPAEVARKKITAQIRDNLTQVRESVENDFEEYLVVKEDKTAHLRDKNFKERVRAGENNRFKVVGDAPSKWGYHYKTVEDRYGDQYYLCIDDGNTELQKRKKKKTLEQSKIAERAEMSSINKVVTLPDWFLSVENDAVRVATINHATKYFENLAKRTDGGGNEAKIIRALKTLNSEHFQEYLLKKKPKNRATVNLNDLKNILPGKGLNNEDYLAVLNILEELSDDQVTRRIDEKYLENFEKNGNLKAVEIRNAALQNQTILVQAKSFFVKDQLLEVRVLNDNSFQATLSGEKGFTKINLTRADLDKVVNGEIVQRGDKVIVQAQGSLFEVRQESDTEINRFYTQKGRDINLDKAVYQSEQKPDELREQDKNMILSKAVVYLSNMLDAQELNKYMRANADGRVYLTGEDIEKTLQDVMNNAVEALSYREVGDSARREYYIEADKVNALTHEAFERRIPDFLPQKKMEWKIKALANSNFDTKITGATMTEKVKFFGIPLTEIQKELSRDEYVTYGAETDFFEVFERKIHTDLMKLVNDGVFTDSKKFDQMVKKVKEMGEVSWEKEQNNRNWLSKIFGDLPPKGFQLESALFKRGVYSLVQKSHKEGTDLATELRNLYENSSEQAKLTWEQMQAIKTFQDALEDLKNISALENAFVNLNPSSLKFGVMLSGLEYGNVNLPEDEEILVSETSQTAIRFLNSEMVESWEKWNETSRSTEHDTQQIISDETWGEWEVTNMTTETEGNTVIITTHYEREGQRVTVKTYEDTTAINYERKGTKTTVTTYEDTETGKKTYKVTKYQKKSPKQKLEITIDATQNIFSVEAIPGLELSANAGIGGVINNLSEKGYISLGLDARGQLTSDLELKLGAGEKFRNGEFVSSLSTKLDKRVNENLKIFAGVNSSALDAWSELLSLDQMVAKTGAEYDFDKWTLETSIMFGDSLKGLSVLFKKNKNAFIEGLKETMNEVSNDEADMYTREIYGESVNVENYRADAKLFLGGLKYSKAVQGSLTKFGISAMSVGVDRILSLVLGFATSEEIVKKVSPHESRAHENFRNFLSKSGENLSKIRHVQKISLDELKVSQNTYRILPKGYAEQYLPKMRANQSKYVEVNVYVDPAIKDKLTIKTGGTFVIQEKTEIKPFILNKTLSDGHTEINVHFGDREASVFSSENLITSGRVEAGGSFKLSKQTNVGFEKKEVVLRREKFKGMIEKVNQVTGILETKFLREMQNGKYKQYLGIEEHFRLKLDVKDSDFTKRIAELSNQSYGENVATNLEQSLKDSMGELLGNIQIPEQIITETVFSALVKARMRHDAIKDYGENWKKGNYTEILQNKKAYAVQYANKWNKTLSETFGVQDSGFLNPETALNSVAGRNDTDVRNISGGWGYIMWPDGEPVILSQLKDAQIVHPKEKIVTGSDGAQYRLITGYLQECRNPMFVLQKIEQPRTKNVRIIPDQERVVSNIGVNVSTIDLQIGLRASPPTVGSNTYYETKVSVGKTQRQEVEIEELRDYKTETLKEIREETETETLHDEKTEVKISSTKPNPNWPLPPPSPEEIGTWFNTEGIETQQPAINIDNLDQENYPTDSPVPTS